VPLATQWQLEIHNVPREVSWQDLKDFCFRRSSVRPSHANVHLRKEGLGTISLANPDDMRRVVHKLNGEILNGKPLRVIDISSGGRREERHRESRMDRSPHHHHHGNTRGHHASNHRGTHHSSSHHRHSTSSNHHGSSSHHHASSRGHHSDHYKENAHDGSSHSRKRRHSHETPVKQPVKEESMKVIIHQPTGDKVITEKITNIDAYIKHEEPHSDNEEIYFKRHRRTSHSSRRAGGGGGSGGGGDERDRDVRLFKKTRAIYKYGMPFQTKWKISVENLSPDVSWQDLKDLCRPYADVRYADAHKPIPGEGNICVNKREGLDNLISNLHETEIKGNITQFIDVSFQEDKSSDRSGEEEEDDGEVKERGSSIEKD